MMRKFNHWLRRKMLSTELGFFGPNWMVRSSDRLVENFWLAPSMKFAWFLDCWVLIAAEAMTVSWSMNPLSLVYQMFVQLCKLNTSSKHAELVWFGWPATGIFQTPCRRRRRRRRNVGKVWSIFWSIADGCWNFILLSWSVLESRRLWVEIQRNNLSKRSWVQKDFFVSMQFTCVHTIQHSLNSCLLLRPYRSEGAPCADWLCANKKIGHRVGHSMCLLACRHNQGKSIQTFVQLILLIAFSLTQLTCNYPAAGNWCVWSPLLLKATSCRIPKWPSVSILRKSNFRFFGT